VEQRPIRWEMISAMIDYRPMKRVDAYGDVL
jgi:hypothetical protein